MKKQSTEFLKRNLPDHTGDLFNSLYGKPITNSEALNIIKSITEYARVLIDIDSQTLSKDL